MKSTKCSGGWEHRAPHRVPDKSLTALLADVKECVFVFDDHRRFAAASKPLLDLFGLSEDRLIGRECRELVDDPSGSLNSGQSGSVILRTADGRLVRGQVRISRLEVEGQRSLFVGIFCATRGSPVAAAASTLPRPATGSGEAAGFSRKLQARLADTGAPYRVMAGRIELISLEEVKAAVGDRWHALADRAKTLARSIIAKRLAADDVCAESENDSFVICFGSLDPSAARIKSELIAREIRERLLGESANAYAVAAQVEQVELRAEDVGRGSNLLSALVTHLDEARAVRDQMIDLTAEEMLRTAELVLSPVLTHTRAPSGIGLACLGNECASFLSRISGADGEKTVIFDMDSLLLTLAIKHLLQQRVLTTTLLVPVSFSTLSEKRLLNDYVALCGRMDRSVCSRLMFELHGVPRDTPQLRLQEILGRLTPYSAHRVVRLAAPDRWAVDLSRHRLAAVSLMANRTHYADRNARREFNGFALSIRSRGPKVLVRNVPDDEVAKWYCANGVDLLCFTERLPGAVQLGAR